MSGKVASRVAAFLLALVVLAGCGGGSLTAATTSTTTTTTAPSTTDSAGCPTDFKVGEEHDADPSCWPAMLDAFMKSHNVPYDPIQGQTQAASICNRLDTEIPSAAIASILADWASGAVKPPVQGDKARSTYLTGAVAVYCPAHYGDLPKS